MTFKNWKSWPFQASSRSCHLSYCGSRRVVGSNTAGKNSRAGMWSKRQYPYKKLWALPNKGWGKKWITHIYGQTPESDIPPSYRATRRYTKIHLGFCLRFSTLIGQIGRVPLFGAGPRRYIRSRLFRLAVTAFWRALPFPGGEKASESRDLSSGH